MKERYSAVKVEALSKQQVSKLLNGHSVRIKYEASGPMTLHLTEQQHKKLLRAHKKGASYTVSFDPYQQDDHQGLREMVGGKINFKKIGKTVLKGVKKVVTSKTGKKIQRNLLNTALGAATVAGLDPRATAVLGSVGHQLIEAEGLKEDAIRGVKKYSRKALQEGKKYGKEMAKRTLPHVSKYLKEEVAELKPHAQKLLKKGIKKLSGDDFSSETLAYMASERAQQILNDKIKELTGHGVKRGRGRPKKGGALFVAGR
jgi:hypothetical protein